MNKNPPEGQASKSTEGLRILFVSDAAPSRNGVGAYYQDLCRTLEPHLERLEFICPQIIDGRWEAGLVFPMLGDPTQKICFPNYWKMRKLIDEMKPQIIVVATPGVYGLCAARLAYNRKIPFFTGFHTSFEHLTELYWGKSLTGRLVEWYFKRCNSYLIKRTALVLGNSESILEQAKKLGADKLQLIGTPLASDFITPPVSAPSGKIERCLFAGRLAQEKNIEAIIEAAEKLPHLQFSFAGDGPMRDEVEQASRRLGNLSYLGWQEREALRQLIDEHDVLLLPSHYETFGTIALETMARARIAVVSSGCGISQWQQLNNDLVILPAQQSLSECLENLADTPSEQLRTLADKARTSALKLNEEVAEQWLALFRHSAAEPQGKL